MRRTHWIGALSIVAMLIMSANATLGVAARTDDVEPVGFTGWLHDLGDECGRGGTYEVIDGVRQTRGYCHQKWMGTSDPRFTGTLTSVVNVDGYVHGDVVPDEVSLWVSTLTRRVENEGGAWHGDATASITVDDVREGGEGVISPQVVVFTGTGDYDGLTAVVWWLQPLLINSQVRGVIFPGSPPPVPQAESVESQPAE